MVELELLLVEDDDETLSLLVLDESAELLVFENCGLLPQPLNAKAKVAKIALNKANFFFIVHPLYS